jgi:hypothetical protein
MQRLVLINYFQDAIHQFLTFAVTQLAESDSAAQMFGFIRITARAAQRALASNFDREGWCFPT